MVVRLAELEGGSTDVTVTVPDGAATTVAANHGDVRVTGIKAAVTVTANHGDVEFSTITGDATARMNRSDSSFSAHNVTGAVTLRGRAQDLNVEGRGRAVVARGRLLRVDPYREDRGFDALSYQPDGPATGAGWMVISRSATMRA